MQCDGEEYRVTRGFSEEVARWGMCIVYSETHHARCTLYALSIIVKCIARPTFLDVIAPAVAGDEEIPRADMLSQLYLCTLCKKTLLSEFDIPATHAAPRE